MTTKETGDQLPQRVCACEVRGCDCSQPPYFTPIGSMTVCLDCYLDRHTWRDDRDNKHEGKETLR